MEIKELIKIECDNDYKDLIQDAIDYLNERVECGSNGYYFEIKQLYINLKKIQTKKRSVK